MGKKCSSCKHQNGDKPICEKGLNKASAPENCYDYEEKIVITKTKKVRGI